jgi:DHA1 family bicyclomycin/chloramphenicol resistance-like MFS transporter
MGLGACLLTLGGLGAVASVALDLSSALTLVIPVAIYVAGMGMVLPQGIAGALTPFPERAGAASALFGFIQQSCAAFVGALVGWLLGHTAWPLAGGVAIMGCATLVLWVLTRGVRSKAAAAH